MTTPDETAATATNDDDLDLDDRQLCPDDNCIGVLGPDGRCKECGRQGTATSRNGSKIEVIEAPVTPATSRAASERDADGDDGDADGAAWDDRALCADDTCIGVLDDNGVCKECGKRAGAS